MPSNVENILNAILTGDGSGIQKPASRVEELLFEIYEQGGGGGGEFVIGGIKLTIDENYVMTATLVDKDGEEYGVSDNIDLPLEEMVVDAEYDPQTQKIKLELKNGNYVEFSVAELVSGLQTELSSSNKLNPAYIAYDASHRAVSDTEKNTWNAKQAAISDLETIRSGAAKGATAVQPATMTEALSAKQNSLSGTQLAAVNSGITSEKVGQISTNQTNILYVLQKVGTNIANVPEEQTVRSITFTRNSDGWITSSASSDTAAWTVANANIEIQLEAKNYTIVWEISSDSDDTVELALFMPSGTQLFSMSATTSNRKVTRAFTVSSGDVGTFHIMYKTRTQKARLLVVETSVYNAYSEYQLYGAPNSDLTYLEAEDRAALAEEIDAGAKNLYDINSSAYVSSTPSITYSKDSSKISVSSTANYTYVEYSVPTTLNTGTYVLSFDITGYTGNTVSAVEIRTTSGTVIASTSIFNSNGNVTCNFAMSSSGTIKLRICCNLASSAIAVSYNVTNIMITTKAAFGVSPAFVPFTLKPPRMIYKSAKPDLTTTEAVVSDLTYSIPSNYMARISVVETNDGAPPSKLRLAQDSGMTSTENYKEVANAGDGISMVAVYRAGYAKTIYVSTATTRAGKNTINMLIELFEV